MNKESSRQIDPNGFMSVRRNPISRVGVFPYLGSTIGAENPDQIYFVYRPEETLSDPEAIDSFKLKPIVDDHEWLGDPEEGHTAAEDHGIHGTTGEDVVYEDGILYAGLHFYSNKLKKTIEDGKSDLSLGYRCDYEKQSGTYEGQDYQYVQRNMRGNHLAVVDEARCAVQVLDQKITFDNLDLTIIKEQSMKTKDDKKEEAKKALAAAIAALTTLQGLFEDAEAESGEEEVAEEAGEAAAEEVAADEPKPAEAAADADGEEKPKAEDDDVDLKKGKEGNNSNEAALSKAVDAAVKKATRGLDAATVERQINAKNKLAEDLSEHIGTFDHAGKTITEVAKYGLKKIGLDSATGQELATLRGFLHAAAKKPVTIAQDAAPASAGVSAFLATQN